MMIESGLFRHMVLQRTQQGVCDVVVSGSCRLAGPVAVRVRRSKALVKGFNCAVMGRAVGGSFTLRLKGLPVGGPYDIELSIQPREGRPEVLGVRDVLVGDVWILAGQSNMQGAGARQSAEKPHRLVRAFYMHDNWAVARDPLHNLWNAVDSVHGGNPDARDPGVGGVGPGVAFGQEMHRRTHVPQGLMACAHGGTSMSQWDPALEGQGGASFYGAMLRRFRKNGSRVAGVVWYQGESDTDANSVPRYTARMRDFVRAARRDMKNPKLPFVTTQLSWYGGQDKKYWNAIQEQQRLLPRVIPGLAVVPTIEMTLCDHIHLDGPSQAVLGRRMAEAMCALTLGPKAGTLPIDLKKISLQKCDIKGHVDIVVEFDHVAGALQSTVRPFGFTVCGPNGPVPCFHNMNLDGNKVILRTTQFPDFFIDKHLHYGYGTNPACNITDGRGYSLPVFGPVPLTRLRLATPFVRSVRVSEPLPGSADLQTLGYPADITALAAKTLNADAGCIFLDSHLDIQRVGVDAVVFHLCRIRCAEDMRLALLLGCDGPVKAWVDGIQVYHDPKGRNPALADSKSAPFNAPAGEHTVVVALGTNQARAWGLFMRFERRDVSLKAAQQKPVAMPDVLPVEG